VPTWFPIQPTTGWVWSVFGFRRQWERRSVPKVVTIKAEQERTEEQAVDEIKEALRPWQVPKEPDARQELQQRAAAVSPYRQAPARRTFTPVGPSQFVFWLGLTVTLGAQCVIAFWLPWYAFLPLCVCALGGLLSWARAWRTARLWQHIAYKYGEPPADLPPLDKPLWLTDTEWWGKTAVAVADLEAEFIHPEPTHNDVAREYHQSLSRDSLADAEAHSVPAFLRQHYDEVEKLRQGMQDMKLRMIELRAHDDLGQMRKLFEEQSAEFQRVAQRQIELFKEKK
jgi:hypothetical protein